MPIQDKIDLIDQWLEQSEMTESRLGLLACANASAVARIRAGTASVSTLVAVLDQVMHGIEVPRDTFYLLSAPGGICKFGRGAVDARRVMFQSAYKGKKEKVTVIETVTRPVKTVVAAELWVRRLMAERGVEHVMPEWYRLPVPSALDVFAEVIKLAYGGKKPPRRKPVRDGSGKVGKKRLQRLTPEQAETVKQHWLDKRHLTDQAAVLAISRLGFCVSSSVLFKTFGKSGRTMSRTKTQNA